MTRLFAGPRSTSFYTPVRFASSRSLFPLSNMPYLVGGSYPGPTPSAIRDSQEKNSDFDHKCRYNMTSHVTEYVSPRLDMYLEMRVIIRVSSLEVPCEENARIL